MTKPKELTIADMEIYLNMVEHEQYVMRKSIGLIQGSIKILSSEYLKLYLDIVMLITIMVEKEMITDKEMIDTFEILLEKQRKIHDEFRQNNDGLYSDELYEKYGVDGAHDKFDTMMADQRASASNVPTPVFFDRKIDA